jgi:hypothetical protein
VKLNNKASFRVYIDESGDEGFLFREDGSGSSRWFVISALVVRIRNDLKVVDCLKESRKLLCKPIKYPLHFVDLKHEQRVPYARRIGNLPARTVSVLIHKPSIREPEKFQHQKYLLYRYATRLLLERVSWLSRDHLIQNEGNGTCAIEHSKFAGLQAADAVASSLHFAVKRNRYGETEPAYSKLLRSTFYKHKGEVQGYGLKTWPESLAMTKTKAPEAENLEGL